MYRSEQDIAGNTINLTVVDRRLPCPVEWSDTASFMSNAFLQKKFSKFDPLGQWYITSSGESNPELKFQLPKGAVLELTFDYIVSDELACPSVSASASAWPRVYTNQLNAGLTSIGKTYASVISM